jgi:hypothetical protein
MTNRSRRELLCGATGALVLAAGCIADDLGGSTESDDSPEENGDSEDDGTHPDESDDKSTDDESTDDEPDDSIETRAFRHPGSTPEPTGVLLSNDEDADAWLEDRRIDDNDDDEDENEDERDSIVEFVDETSFDGASLVALEASAPNLCYELELESATVEDERLELEAVVTEDDGDEMGCAQQETTVGYLIRASADGEPVDEASATVVDRDGAEHDLEIDAEDDRENDGAENDGAEDDEDE